MMKKIFYLTLVLSTLFISCDKDQSNNNVHDQQWFIDLAEPCNANDICKLAIHKSNYNGNVVYHTSLSGPLCDPIFSIALLNFSGDTVKFYDEDMYNEFNNEVTFIETIYRCDE